MSPHELRVKLAELGKAQDEELDKFEREIAVKYRHQRRDVLREAGLECALAAECESAYYEFWPPKSDLPRDTPLVSYDGD